MLQPESSVINLGPPGSGKSTIGNVLLTGSAEKQVFLAMDAPDQGGVTRILNSKTGYLFGNKSN
jgi:replication-associated recombination protein RarA